MNKKTFTEDDWDKIIFMRRHTWGDEYNNQNKAIPIMKSCLDKYSIDDVYNVFCANLRVNQSHKASDYQWEKIREVLELVN